MLKYILKRIGLAIIVLFGVSVIIYFLMRLMPSDFVDSKFGPLFQSGKFTEEDMQRMREIYGIGDRDFVSILTGYFKWIGAVFTGDLGISFVYERPVGTVIFEHMGVSFGIAFVAYLLEMLIAIPLGVKAATKQYGVLDYTTNVLTMIGTALPTFFFAAICIQLFGVGVGALGIFPVQGLITPNKDLTGLAYFGDMLWHLILPIGIMVFLSVGSLMRYTRTNTLEVLNADYIRTARAKGLSERKVIYKHAFRNTLIPLVTLLAGMLPSLFSGAMITEQMFSIPGVGYMAYDALLKGDIPFVMGYNMFLAILTVLGMLLADIMYAVVDPRVKIDK